MKLAPPKDLAVLIGSMTAIAVLSHIGTMGGGSRSEESSRSRSLAERVRDPSKMMKSVEYGRSIPQELSLYTAYAKDAASGTPNRNWMPIIGAKMDRLNTSIVARVAQASEVAALQRSDTEPYSEASRAEIYATVADQADIDTERLRSMIRQGTIRSGSILPPWGKVPGSRAMGSDVVAAHEIVGKQARAGAVASHLASKLYKAMGDEKNAALYANKRQHLRSIARMADAMLVTAVDKLESLTGGIEPVGKSPYGPTKGDA